MKYMFPLIPKTKSSVLVRVITKGKPTLILRRMKFCRPLQNPITLYQDRYKEELNRCIYFYGWVFLGFCRCGTYLSSAGIDFLSSFQELINICFLLETFHLTKIMKDTQLCPIYLPLLPEIKRPLLSTHPFLLKPQEPPSHSCPQTVTVKAC